MNETMGLRLLAVDQEDLSVISAAVQDGVCKPIDLVFEAKRHRFHLEFNRFRWELKRDVSSKGERVRSVLSFDSVAGVKSRGLPSKHEDLVLSLLSVEWIADDEPPGGKIRLMFAGDGELLISAECLDATLLDISQPWPTRNRPEHKD